MKVWPGISHHVAPAPAPILTTDSVGSPANMYGMHNQVKCLKLPPPSPQGRVGTFCFPLLQSFGRCLVSLHWPGGCYSTHRCPY